MFVLLLLMSCKINNPAPDKVFWCDMIEYNKVYDISPNGKPKVILTQVIFWDLNSDKVISKTKIPYNVWDFIVFQDNKPVVGHNNSYYYVLHRYTVKGKTFIIEFRSRRMKETKTTYDPELLNREVLPRDLRRRPWKSYFSP